MVAPSPPLSTYFQFHLPKGNFQVNTTDLEIPRDFDIRSLHAVSAGVAISSGSNGLDSYLRQIESPSTH